jgi:hypothetical protein
MQIIQWPVEEVKSLRGNHVNVSNKAVKSGEYFEVTGFKSVQVSANGTLHEELVNYSLHL